MTKVWSLLLLFHILAVGYWLQSRTDFFRPRVFAGVVLYFFVAFVAMAYGLRLVPAWIDPRL